MPQRMEWNRCKYWSSTEGLEEYVLKQNDIVMALDRPWISESFKIAMVDSENLPALLIQRTARIRAKDLSVNAASDRIAEEIFSLCRPDRQIKSSSSKKPGAVENFERLLNADVFRLIIPRKI